VVETLQAIGYQHFTGDADTFLLRHFTTFLSEVFSAVSLHHQRVEN
jgi:hypothetical protein